MGEDRIKCITDRIRECALANVFTLGDQEKREGSNCGRHGERRWVWGGVWLIVVREILWEKGVDVSGTFGVNKRVLKCQGCEGKGEDWEDSK
jgi:hypothetical protein